MIETTASATHRVECHAGRSKLISNIIPGTGYSTWCQRCKIVHEVAWKDLPAEILREIRQAIDVVLESPGV